MIAKIPNFIKKLYPKRIWGGPKNGNCIYLTFDDGPIPEVTPWVLEQLRKYDAKATFFCIGDNIKKHPDVFKRVVSEGHTVGSHTFNHLNGWKTPTKEYLLNVEAGQKILEEQLPKNSPTEIKDIKNKLFRPPYGRIKAKQARELQEQDYTLVMWDVLSMDYDQKLSHEACYQRVLRNTGNGSIIVFHDSLKAERNLKIVLPQVLEYYSAKGYVFKKLSLRTTAHN